MERPSEPFFSDHVRVALGDDNDADMKSGVQLLSPSLQRGLRATTTASSRPAVFDYDSFTLESVRRRHDSHLHPAASSSNGSPRSPSMARASSRAFSKDGSLDGFETSSARSLDDFDWASRNTHVSSTYSQGSSRQFPPLSSVGKRMSIASSTASSAMRSKSRPEVVVRGWLQRRRGRMIKRWKAQYCVLKTDQKLCLYASEDTVNGRLEGRFQVLRVTYNDKNSSFQVIGIGSDETPYKEEFRPLDEDGWRAWFQALREFFTAASLNEALERMPELSLVPGVHAALLEDDDDEVGGDFAHEVEEMIMRPYAFGGIDDRGSISNTSSTSSSNQNQRTHRRSTVATSDFEKASEPVADRKTVLFDPNDFPRFTTSNQVAESPGDLPDYSVARASNYHKLYTGGRRSQARSVASSSADSLSNATYQPAPNSLLRREPSAQLPPPVGPMDCPMIERDSQNAMAILERCGSESVISNSTSDSDHTFTWNHA